MLVVTDDELERFAVRSELRFLSERLWAVRLLWECGANDRTFYIILFYDCIMKKKDNIVIPRKAMAGIAPAVAIMGVLIAKKGPGEMILFGLGIFVGVMIARGYFVK